MKKPDCYKCVYRKDIAGDAHSCCVHPDTGLAKSKFPEFEGLTAILGIGKSSSAIYKMEIKGNSHGIRSGWFMWPGNFDPVWLENCNGFKSKAEVENG